MRFDKSVAVLEIIHADLEDSGDYICEAQNEAGSASCNVAFTVKEPPVFFKTLETINAIKGSDVVQQCEISGTSPFEITWYKDKRQIRASKKYKITYENHVASIHILKVETPDIGEYMCVVKNDVGGDTCIGTLNLK
eukprot:g34865.t1